MAEPEKQTGKILPVDKIEGIKNLSDGDFEIVLSFVQEHSSNKSGEKQRQHSDSFRRLYFSL